MKYQQQGAYPVARASRQPVSQPRRSVQVDDLEEADSYYVTRPPTSARRYAAPQQPPPPQVIQQGNRRLVIHREPPPSRVRYHWLVYVGIAVMVMLIGWLLFTMLGVWWQAKQDDWAFGHPRTYQTDANVGHSSGQSPMSHFVAMNLAGIVQVIEIPGNDASKAKIYTITTLQSGSTDIPVTLSFRDINADGKPDLLVTIGDPGSLNTIILFNNGSQFVTKL